MIVREWLGLFPKTLFRASIGPTTVLQPYIKDKPRYYDIETRPGGFVRPLPSEVKGHGFRGPNGAPLRPNCPFFHALVTNHWKYKSDETIIYAVPEGTEIPMDLVLIRSQPDLYGLGPEIPMHLDDLNQRLTSFFNSPAVKKYTRDEWLAEYPAPEKVVGSTITRSIRRPSQNSELARKIRYKTGWREMYAKRYGKKLDDIPEFKHLPDRGRS